MNIPSMVPMEFRVLPRLTLHVCPTDRFKIGQFSLRAILPNTAQTLLTSAALLPVLRRGTQRYPTQELINRRLDDLYATDCRVVNSSVGRVRCLGFTADFPESRVLPDGVSLLPEVIDMMTELLFYPARQEDGALISRYVESERGHLIDAIASLVNHPASYAHAHFNAAFARDRDAIAPIRMEEVEALQERDLRELLHSIHTQAHFHAFYIGATPPEQLLRILAEHMGPILGQSQPPMSQLGGTALPARAQVLTVEEQLPSGQSHLIIGYRTPITLASPAYGAMMVCNEMLGGSPVSRLFTQLREAKSLCYSCYSDYLPDRGELMASCAIDRADRQAAQTAIREQIEALKCGDFTDAEMDAAKNLLLNGYLQLEDSTRSISSFYRVRHLMGVTQTIDECRAAISAVSRKQLICAANTLQEDTVYFLEGTATNAAGDEEDEYEDDNE